MNPVPTRVLVVDDERFFREAIRELLESEGIDVRLAASAAEALEAAEDPSVGVAVLDIQLPDQSGLTVLRLLRERRPALRVVMLSAHTDQEYVLEALRLGACDYLAKPLHEEEVKLSVRRALDAFEMASSWSALRGRLGKLAGEIEALLGDGVRSERESLAVRAAEAVARLLDAQKTSILLRDDREGRLRVAAATGRKLGPEHLDAVGVGEGVAGRAVAHGEAIVVEDVGRDPRFPAAPADRYDSSSFVVMPLGVGRDRFGAEARRSPRRTSRCCACSRSRSRRGSTRASSRCSTPISRRSRPTTARRRRARSRHRKRTATRSSRASCATR